MRSANVQVLHALCSAPAKCACCVHTLAACHAMQACMHKCQGQYASCKQEAGQTRALPVWKQVSYRLYNAHAECMACIA